MKRRSEKPSESAMQFFTPELFVRYNSQKDEDADNADAAWEAAIQAYRRHLKKLGDRLPRAVQSLTEMCLHDAEVLAGAQEIDGSVKRPSHSGVAVVAVQHKGRILSLIYVLWDRIRHHAASKGWPFSKLKKHWLYDEVDVAPNREHMFLHRILFSDGTSVVIPFISVIVHSFAVPVLNDGNGSTARFGHRVRIKRLA